jgi:hypothetical protein
VVSLIAKPGHLVAERTYAGGRGGMAKTGVFFITQNMVVGQNRNTVIFLRIQAADPRQTVTDADLNQVWFRRSLSLFRIG